MVDRLFSSYHNKDGTRKLITWVQRRCEICKKFLGRKQKKYCTKHGYIMSKIIPSEINYKIKYNTNPKFREDERVRLRGYK